jgi:hypothetical protein
MRRTRIDGKGRHSTSRLNTLACLAKKYIPTQSTLKEILDQADIRINTVQNSFARRKFISVQTVLGADYSHPSKCGPSTMIGHEKGIADARILKRQ